MIEVRNTRPDDIPGIIETCREVYPSSPSWTEAQLSSHLRVFPAGQFVALDGDRIVGMAAGLILRWDDYALDATWRDFTDAGMFTNHDPAQGRTYYAAEVMVRPSCQGKGVGSRIHEVRRGLIERLGLLRIRAGARLRGYHRFAREMSPEDYVIRVVRGELRDPTLSFQLSRGFRVLAVVSGYLKHDPESLGYAAVIEWLNERVARPEDCAARDPRFDPRRP